MLAFRKRQKAVATLTVAVLMVASLSGCQKKAPPAAPLDLTKTISELDFLSDTIAKFCGGDDSVGGHESLHRIGITLKELIDAGDRTGLDESQQAEFAASANSMLDAYGELDEALHADKKFNYSSIEPIITDNLKKLRAAATLKAGSSEP